ncbi:MAG: tetratricopeptide repeat protein, partial [Rhodospirillales bacterium]|nr:tetratricopeptide repeat protein [Rhodospirillales bacterium]
GFAATGPVGAESVPIRVGTHPGYGRIVFAWPQSVGHQAEIRDGRLTVTFERAVEADFAPALRVLRNYLTDATPGADGRSVSFGLAGTFELRTFLNKTAVVVDLLDPQGEKAAAQPTTPERAPPARREASRPEPPQPSPESVSIRAGVHPDKTRVVVDWRVPVSYALDRQGDTLTLFFDRPANLDLGRIADRPPPRVLAASVESAPASSVLTLAIQPGATVNHFLAGTRVVVDILAADASLPADSLPAAPSSPAAGAARTVAAAPPAPLSSPPPAPAPAASPPSAPRSLVPSSPAAPPQRQPAPPPAPGATSAPAASPSPSPSAPSPRPVPSGAQSAALPVDAGQPISLVPGGPAVTIREREEPRAAADDTGRSEATGPSVGVTLRFDWTEPTALAIFRRAGSLWVVFDRPSKPDLEALQRQGGNVIRSVTQIPNEGATILRMDAVAGINPVPRRDGLTWMLNFHRQPIEAANRLDVTVQPQARRGRVLIPVSDVTTVFALTDPEVGDNLMVVPIAPLSYGMTYPYEFAHFALIPTGQGVVVRPRIDNLQVRAVPQGVEITSPDGLPVSEVTAEDEAQVVFGLNRPLSRVLDLDRWRIADQASFVPRRQSLQIEVAKSKPGEAREKARLDLIRFLFANGFFAEAIGVIEAAVADRAAVADSAEFRLLRGGTRFMLGRIDEARQDLFDKSLDGLDEGLFWRAIVEAVDGDRAQAARELRRVGPMIRFYPRGLSLPLGLIVAETAIDLGDFKVAIFYLESLLALGPTPHQKAHIDYLEGRIFELTGDFDKALEKWEAVAKGSDPLARFRAKRDHTELLIKLERIEPAAAIEALEGLRYAWRGDDLEFALLRRLGGLYLETEDYKEGLRTLRQAATYFREHARAPEVTQQMAEIFARLFLEDQADKLSPVSAIALFEEFRELTPVGARGDEMIRKLADRLTRVDLLDRAAELLRGQIEFRLKGVDRARIGGQLALVYLLDQKPDEAIAVLDQTDEAGLPASLAAQRLHLRARALMAKGDGAAALAVLKDDRSLDGERLKAEIYWEAQDWERTVQAFQRVLREAKAEPRRPLDKAQAGHVFNLAIAMTLAGNERGVARLRAEYGEAMAQSEFARGFDLIAGQSALTGIGRADVAGEVQEAQGFQTFLSAYKERLREQGLSSIN